MKTSRLFAIPLLALALYLASCGGKGNEGDDTLSMLLAGYVLSQEPPADIIPDRGFPLSAVSLTGTFPGVAGEYAITVSGTAATGITIEGSGNLTFTMPEVEGIGDNRTVQLVVSRSGATVLSKTIRYRPAPILTLNEPNDHLRKLNTWDTKSFFKITSGTTGPHLFNVYGYGGNDLDIAYMTNPAAATVNVAQSAMQDAEFGKATISAGTFYVQITRNGGFGEMFFRMQAANSGMKAVSTSNEFASYRRCYDFSGPGTTLNLAASCETANAAFAANRTGRCSYPGTGGITTRSYYDYQNYGFDQGYAETTCTQEGYDSPNPAHAIFIPG